MTRPLASFAALCLLSACTTASSTDIRTSGLYATISGTADGKGDTSVSTSLQLGPLSTTFVEMSGGDSLSASSGGAKITLNKFSLLGLVSYSGTLSGDEEGKSVTVALSRGATDTSAPNSVLTLPAKFQLTGPIAGTNFVRGKDPIEVRWDASGKPDAMTVELSGTCIQTVSKSPADNGLLLIPFGEIKASKDNATKVCDVEVSVKRTRSGTLDPAYGKGGSVTGVQARTLKVKSSP